MSCDQQVLDRLTFQTLTVSITRRVMCIQFNQPTTLNALSQELISDLSQALTYADMQDGIGAVVLTGSEKAFAAGADIKEIQSLTFPDVLKRDFVFDWECVARCRKPIIAVVRGYALGGGCELAMMCDMIYAGHSARFAQPEVTLGTMPGAGGTQRLTQLVGKMKAMELCLTGRMIDAHEAERIGLVTRVFEDADVLDQARACAHKISELSAPVVSLIKQSVQMASESLLIHGLKSERQSFYSTFALEDCAEGMRAFIEKKPPVFKHR